MKALVNRFPALRRLADWLKMPEPIASADAITAVVRRELRPFNPADDEPSGFMVHNGDLIYGAGVFVVYYPFDADVVMVEAWLTRAYRVLRRAGYTVTDDDESGRPVLLVSVG